MKVLTCLFSQVNKQRQGRSGDGDVAKHGRLKRMRTKVPLVSLSCWHRPKDKHGTRKINPIPLESFAGLVQQLVLDVQGSPRESDSNLDTFLSSDVRPGKQLEDKIEMEPNFTSHCASLQSDWDICAPLLSLNT